MSKMITESYPITKFNGIVINTSIPSSSSNYYSYSSRSVKYVVMHYTGNSKDTAKANATYFNGGSRGASAHYFVDENNCYQSVALNNAAWAVGGTTVYKHSECRNLNSVSIEMCTSGNYQISEKTEINAAYLCAQLCTYIGITASQVDTYVLHHWDVWAKDCPSGWTGNSNSRWIAFKERVKSILSGTSESVHWGEEFLNKLANSGIVENKEVWSYYDSPTTKSMAAALIDKATGGMWTSNEDDASIHWVQPNVISLCGKGIITDKSQWLTNPDASISCAMLLALIDKATGGMKEAYIDRSTDHWGRNHLDSLCDKGIVTTPDAWTCFEGEVTRANCMALICKALVS